MQIMRKPALSIRENKGAVQLHSNRASDQRLNFTTLIVQSLSFQNLKFQASVVVQPCLCWPWLKTPEDRFSCEAALIVGFKRKIFGDN